MLQEMIKKIKTDYPMMADYDDDEFIQVFGDEYPEFLVVGDEDWFKYEFVNGEFLRGADSMFELKFNMMKEYLSSDNSPALMRAAIEGDYLGFIIKYGCHPSITGMDNSMLADSERTNTRKLTRMSNGRTPDAGNWITE